MQWLEGLFRFVQKREGEKNKPRSIGARNESFVRVSSLPPVTGKKRRRGSSSSPSWPTPKHPRSDLSAPPRDLLRARKKAIPGSPFSRADSPRLLSSPTSQRPNTFTSSLDSPSWLFSPSPKTKKRKSTLQNAPLFTPERTRGGMKQASVVIDLSDDEDEAPRFQGLIDYEFKVAKAVGKRYRQSPPLYG